MANIQEYAAEFVTVCDNDTDDSFIRRLEKAYRKAHNGVSTIVDYLPYLKLCRKFPAIHEIFSPVVQGVPLMLECRVECPCTGSSCRKSHERVWIDNYKELDAAGLLPLVTEFRIILHTDSPKDLNLDLAIQQLGIPHGMFPNIQLIKILGRGLFYAGWQKDMTNTRVQDEIAAEAIRTAKLILDLCPHANKLWYHESPSCGFYEGLLWDIPGIGSEILLALRRELLPRLKMMQIARPLTDSIIQQQFSPNLQYLSMDLKLVAELKRMPPIPTTNMVHLELYRISRDIDWSLFMTGLDGKAHFPNLKTLVLVFDKPEVGAAFSSSNAARVVIPSTVTVTVIGLNNSKGTVEALFKERKCARLTLMESPSFLQRLDRKNLKCSRKVEVVFCPTPDKHKRPLSDNGLWSFFGHSNNVMKEISISGMDMVMPPVVLWCAVEVLHMTVGIADFNSLLNLTHKLKNLGTLKIKCFSMNCGDLNDPRRGYRFAGEKEQHRITDAFASDVPEKIFNGLTSLHVSSEKGIVTQVFQQLVSRIPTLGELFVNSEAVDAVREAISGSNVTVGVVDPDSFEYL